jgi:hypothetical protein
LPALGISSEQINDAYKKEIDSDVKERIFFLSDELGLMAMKHQRSERELHKTRWWAYTSG